MQVKAIIIACRIFIISLFVVFYYVMAKYLGITPAPFAVVFTVLYTFCFTGYFSNLMAYYVHYHIDKIKA